MANYYNRYQEFTINGENITVPFLRLTSKSSDKRVVYKVGSSRLDKISQQYYDSPYFGWLILQANPQVGGLEWDIKDGQVLTVPYPLVASLQEYRQQIQDYYFFNGKNPPFRKFPTPTPKMNTTPLTFSTNNTSTNTNNNVSSNNNTNTTSGYIGSRSY